MGSTVTSAVNLGTGADKTYSMKYSGIVDEFFVNAVDEGATKINNIYKRGEDWTTLSSTIPSSSTTYSDNTVVAGQWYKYRVAATSNTLTGYASSLGLAADGIPNGGVTQNSAGKVGSYSWSFDGVNDYVTIGSSLSQFDFMYSGVPKMTVNFWYKPSTGMNFPVVLDHNSGGAGKGLDFYFVGTGVNNVMTMSLSSDPNNNLSSDQNDFLAAMSTTNLKLGSAGTWEMWTLTYDYSLSSNQMKIYKNAGTPETSNTYSGSSTPTSGNTPNPLAMGRSYNGYYLKGELDELSIWNRALSAAEISTLYNSGNGKSITDAFAEGFSSSNIKAYYDFEQTSGSLTNKVAGTAGANSGFGAPSATATQIVGQAPDPPTGITVSGAESGTNWQHTVTWTAPSFSGTTAISGYKIERATDSGFTTGVTTLSANTGSTAVTYTDSPVPLSPISQSYFYRVSAINSIGTGVPSTVSSAAVSPPLPDAPTNISGTNVVVGNNAINIVLNWSAPTNSMTPTGYKVERSVSNANYWTVLAANTGSSVSILVLMD